MKKKMNLYTQYLVDEKKGRSVSGCMNGLVFLLAIGLILGAVGVKLFIDKVNLASEINTLESYVNNKDNIKRVGEVDAIIKENSDLNKLKSSIEEITVIFDAKSTLSSGVLNDIEYARPVGLQLDTMNINGPNATLSFSSANQRLASTFVSNLKDSSNIKEVIYKGYTYNDSTEVYNGVISLVLKGDF